MNRKPKPYEDIRDHFILRLKERYDIVITNDEYDVLVKTRPRQILLYKLNSVNSLCHFNIKGKWVLCIWGKQSVYRGYGKIKSKLITCLQHDSFFPCPSWLTRRGFDKFKFEPLVNDIIKQVIEASEVYNEVGDKEFFVNSPYAIAIKCAAKSWSKLGEIKLDSLVLHLVKTEQINLNNKGSIPDSNRRSLHPQCNALSS